MELWLVVKKYIPIKEMIAYALAAACLLGSAFAAGSTVGWFINNTCLIYCKKAALIHLPIHALLTFYWGIYILLLHFFRNTALNFRSAITKYVRLKGGVEHQGRGL